MFSLRLHPNFRSRAADERREPEAVTFEPAREPWPVWALIVLGVSAGYVVFTAARCTGWL